MTPADYLRAADLVLFDAGFTLLEPVRPVPVVYAEAARARGVAVDEAAMTAAVRAAWEADARLRGGEDLRSSEELERAAWRSFTGHVAGLVDGLRDHHEPWVKELFAWFDSPASWRPVEGALELLDDLRKFGKRVGVVSNWHGALHPIARSTGVAERVDFILVSSEVGFRKPHPSIFAKALACAGISSRRTVHVGDSERDDVGGARAAGIGTVRVAPEAVASAAEHVVRALRDLQTR